MARSERQSDVHTFDNGLKVFDGQLIDVQRERYRQHNVHEAEEERLFTKLIGGIDDGGCFINVGAAIGYYVILAKLMRPDLEVVAYEPLRSHAKFLRQNLELNRLDRNDVVIHCEGVATIRGYSNFWIGDFSSMIVGTDRGAGIVSTIRSWFDNRVVRTVPLSEVCRRVGREVGLLQMDIQGAEQSVLESARAVLCSHQIRRLLVGSHSRDIHSQCIRILEECGYQITWEDGETKLQPDGIIVAEAPH